MLRRSSTIMLLAASAAGFAIGQTVTPRAPASGERFTFAMTSDGGYLGVQTVDISKENFAKYGLREVRGVAVEKVMESSPAAAAGLRDGDVIIRFDGEEVGSVRKLRRLISETAADHRVKIAVLRNGGEQDLTATLGKREPMGFASPGAFTIPRMPDMPMSPDVPNIMTLPRGEGRGFAWTPRSGKQIGVGVEVLTKQLAAHFNVEHGLLISDVRENSPAAKAGLKAGDIIVEADGKAVKNDFDLIKAINEKKEGDVSIAYIRGGNRQSVSITPEAAKDRGFLFETDDDDATPPAPAVRTTMPGRVIAPGPVTMVRRRPIL